MAQPEPAPESCGCGSDTCLYCLFDQGQLTADELEAYLMQPWGAATSLADLAGLTADWIDGTISDHPGWSGQPDPETFQIAESLIALNRAGWLTIDSQPGHEANEHGEVQRHAVKLILTPEQAATFQAAFEHTRYLRSLPTPLVPQAPTEYRRAVPVMVSAVAESGHIEGTCWFGTGPDEEWELLFGEDLMRPELRRALEKAMVVAIAAPRWGSDDDGLWDALCDLPAERRELRVEVLCVCDTIVEFAFAARLDPASPSGVVCAGPTSNRCPECGKKVTVPDCTEAGHPWTELTAAGQSIVVCLMCKQSRKAAPVELVGGAR
jgi:hypothetical protein